MRVGELCISEQKDKTEATHKWNEKYSCIKFTVVSG